MQGPYSPGDFLLPISQNLGYKLDSNLYHDLSGHVEYTRKGHALSISEEFISLFPVFSYKFNLLDDGYRFCLKLKIQLFGHKQVLTWKASPLKF